MARLTANGIGVFVSTTVAVLLLLALVPLMTGREPTVVASGSMEPALRRGDVVVLQSSDRDPSKGTVVAFRGPMGMVIHRVDEVMPGPTFLTKGDANSVADSTPIVQADIVGFGVMVVPLVGLPNLWYQEQRWGSLLAAGAGLGAAARVSTRSWLNR